ncbi:DUF308 domain-containing protein [Actinophytocola sp. KF-1]
MILNGHTRAKVVISTRPSHGWRVGLGLFTSVTGLLILMWPRAAVATVAVIVGVHLVVAGVVRAVTALRRDGGVRTLYLVLGLLLVVAGLLCLRSPFHATAVLVVLFGVAWLVNGGIELFHGVSGAGGWTSASGAVSFACGVVVLAYPAPTAHAMIGLFGLSLVAIGLMTFVGGAADVRTSGFR